jgi:hypothetical protein
MLTFFTPKWFGSCEPEEARKANSHGLKLEAVVYSAKLKTRAESGFWRTPNSGDGIRQFSVKLLDKVYYCAIIRVLTNHACRCVRLPTSLNSTDKRRKRNVGIEEESRIRDISRTSEIRTSKKSILWNFILVGSSKDSTGKEYRVSDTADRMFFPAFP